MSKNSFRTTRNLFLCVPDDKNSANESNVSWLTFAECSLFSLF